MSDYLSVFRSREGERQVFEAYDSILRLWPVDYEEIDIQTQLGLTHILVSGPESAPPLLLVHAFYTSAVSWHRNVKSLSANHRVYLVDIIGDPNKSRPLRIIRKASDYITWFNDVLDGLKLGKAIFAGNSVGAFHIMNFALHHPERVSRMVLIGPAAALIKMPKFYLHTFPGGMTGWTILVRHAVQWVKNGAPLDPKFYRLFYRLMKYGKAVNQVFPAVFSDDQLRQIKMPTLLIYGEKEVIYDYRRAIERAVKLIPDVKVELIPDANHLTAASQPEATNKVMLEFMNSAGK